jgi:hypothetical protein
MLHTLTLEHFSPHVGETFRIRLEDERTLDVALVEANAIGTLTNHLRTDGLLTRAPFSLLFKGSADVRLPQKIYRLEHATLPAYEVFMVPIGPGTYEVIFS